MKRDQKRLLKALRELPHVTPFQVKCAYIILSCNGLDEALKYVRDLAVAASDYIMPLEAAEALHHEQLAFDEFF